MLRRRRLLVSVGEVEREEQVRQPRHRETTPRSREYRGSDRLAWAWPGLGTHSSQSAVHPPEKQKTKHNCFKTNIPVTKPADSRGSELARSRRRGLSESQLPQGRAEKSCGLGVEGTCPPTPGRRSEAGGPQSERHRPRGRASPTGLRAGCDGRRRERRVCTSPPHCIPSTSRTPGAAAGGGAAAPHSDRGPGQEPGLVHTATGETSTRPESHGTVQACLADCPQPYRSTSAFAPQTSECAGARL